MHIVQLGFVLTFFASCTVIPADMDTAKLPDITKISNITENLPEPVKTIVHKASHACSKEVWTFFNLYIKPQPNQAITPIAKLMQASDLIFETRHRLAQLIMKSQKHYYFLPDTLIAISAVVEHQVLATHGLTNDAPPALAEFNHNQERGTLFRIDAKKITAALPGCDVPKKHRRLYKLFMLAAAINAEKKQQSERHSTVLSCKDLVDQAVTCCSIVSLYSGSKKYDPETKKISQQSHEQVAAYYIKEMLGCTKKEALKKGKEFVEFVAETRQMDKNDAPHTIQLAQ